MKVKRALSALLCSGMLMLSAMPVSAADCSHVHRSITTSGDKYESIDSDNHRIYYNRTSKCKDCGETVLDLDITKGTEKHSQETLADLGHISPRSHKYKIGCTKCGYSFEVIVPCAGH